MSIRVALTHRTHYEYDRLVTIFPQIVRLRPAPHCRTPVVSYSLRVLPKNHFVNWQQDPHGNFLARFVFAEKAREFSIEVDLVAEMTVINPFDFFLEPSADFYPFRYETWLAEELRPFLAILPVERQLANFLAEVDRSRKRTVDFLVGLNRAVHDRIKYVIRMDPGVQTPEQTLTLGRGSCRDSAWLLVQVLRNLGLAARFVSGYLIQLAADVKPLDGPAGPEQDFTDLHAWAEVYLPGAGWIGLDPTSGLMAGEGHIPLACSPDPASASPVFGTVDPCEVQFGFTMAVRRIHEDPRVTKPYTEDEWREIEALGHGLDAELEAGAVRLTMGGEPTFVSIDDMDGAEWNTAAIGPTKRKIAADLLKRLRGRFAPDGLLHHGEGKWYPGESLPRWAFSCHWRRDGEPIWLNPDLIADERQHYGYGPAEARQFIAALARRLDIDAELAIPAYEDVWHYLWKERRLPTNVDPLESNLDDPEERARLAHVFQQGLNHVVGYALPLRPERTPSGRRWVSSEWFFRREHMFLLPGDSTMGLRLPLDSLPWSVPFDREFGEPIDPFAPREPLPKGNELPAT
ncbi:MAG TPA: transglutaminase family protein, partial [Pirellulales bacterium]